jgi:hypothetical protein
LPTIISKRPAKRLVSLKRRRSSPDTARPLGEQASRRRSPDRLGANGCRGITLPSATPERAAAGSPARAPLLRVREHAEVW